MIHWLRLRSLGGEGSGLKKRKYTKKSAVVFFLAAAMSVLMLSGVVWAQEEGNMADTAAAGNSPGGSENTAGAVMNETVLLQDAGADGDADSNIDGESGESGTGSVDTPTDTDAESGNTGEIPDADGTPDTDGTSGAGGAGGIEGNGQLPGGETGDGGQVPGGETGDGGQAPGGETGDGGQAPGGGMDLPSYLEPTQKVDKLELAKREPVTLSEVSIKTVSFTPQTGDEAEPQTALWIGVMAVAVIAAIVVIVIWKKRK